MKEATSNLLDSRSWSRKFKAKGLDYQFWVQTQSDLQALEDGCWPYPELGEHVCQFFSSSLRHSIGKQWAGKPFQLATAQRDSFMRAFSWLDKKGRRRIRKIVKFRPKKNGKSTEAAGISLYLMRADDEPGAQVYAAAVDRQQAGIVFAESVSMMEQSPPLRADCQVNRTIKRIVHLASRSFLQVLSSESASAQGINAHGLICDELHAWPNFELWDALVYSGRAREQPMQFIISTAGVDVENSIGGKMYTYAKEVLNGSIIDTSVLAEVYEVPMDQDWEDPVWWERANPLWGVTIDPDRFKQEYLEAKARPSQLNSWRRYSLNQWVECKTSAIDMDRWRMCGSPRFDESELTGKPCYLGMDLATKKDTAAVVAIFPSDGLEGDVKVIAHFWLPLASLESRSSLERDLIRGFADSGHVTLTRGPDEYTTDYQSIRREIVEWSKRFGVIACGYDPANIGDLGNQLNADGIQMIEIRQGFVSLNDPSKELERLYLSGRLRHNDNPVLNWMASNLSWNRDVTGNIRPDRTNARSRIDGMVSLIMALRLLTVIQPERSVYEDNDLLVLYQNDQEN